MSPKKRDDLIDALRRGTVPKDGLDQLAVGLEPFEDAIREELRRVAGGSAGFKAVRGGYGCGKTFFSRWLQEEAKQRNFVVSEVQISETETPLHKMETVYRRLIERLGIQSERSGAFRTLIDSWFFTLEEDVISAGEIDANDEAALLAATNELMERRLAKISAKAPSFSAALRAYRLAVAEGDHATAEGLLAWVGGQPHVSAAIKRKANIKGAVDHFAASSFLQGLLTVLKDSGFSGLVLVLDEVETLQRVRGDVREKALNALRQLIDELDAGQFPGLYLVITGTPEFFTGPQGLRKLPPLAQRLDTEFNDDPRFDNPRATQLRLQPFKIERLNEVGKKVRAIYAEGSSNSESLTARVNDEVIERLTEAITGELGGKTGIAPRIFLKKLVGNVLDPTEQHADFDPSIHYKLTLREEELTVEERHLRSADSVEEIDLEL